MAKQKENNFRVVKALREGNWSMCHFATSQEASSWVTPCKHYAIFDLTTGKEVIIDTMNWDLINDKAIWEPVSEELDKINTERVKYNG